MASRNFHNEWVPGARERVEEFLNDDWEKLPERRSSEDNNPFEYILGLKAENKLYSHSGEKFDSKSKFLSTVENLSDAYKLLELGYSPPFDDIKNKHKQLVGEDAPSYEGQDDILEDVERVYSELVDGFHTKL